MVLCVDHGAQRRQLVVHHTAAGFIEAKAGTLDNGTVGGNVVNTYNLKGGANAAKPPPEAPTGLEAWWKWFLRDILYIK